jgi:hypothetical protein
MAFRGNLQVEFFKSEKSARTLNISTFGDIFQIFSISLVSTSKGHAKCFDFFRFSVHFCADLCGYLGGKSGGTLHGL